MGGKMDAAWWRSYRAANRERLNAQQRDRRALRPRLRANRRTEYAKRRATPVEPLPILWLPSHPVIEAAWTFVRHAPRGQAVSFREDELALDCVGEAALAILENRDPAEAVRRFRATETNWMARTAALDDYYQSERDPISAGD